MGAALPPGPTRFTPWQSQLDTGTLARCQMPTPAAQEQRPLSARLSVATSLADAQPTLRAGDRGAAVQRLQTLLLRALPGLSLRADGDFGALTAQAVRRFQASRALLRDGVAGPRTWRALVQPAVALPDAEHLGRRPTTAGRVARPAAATVATTSVPATSPAGLLDGASWMDVARAEIGQAEVGGREANPRIVAYHATTGLGATSDEVPWCASFVNWVFAQAGIRGTNSAAAASWIDWGQACEPTEGAVMVIRNAAAARTSLTASGNHVGFLVEQTDAHYVLLGGNQSDQVKESRFRRSSWTLRACRWPR